MSQDIHEQEEYLKEYRRMLKGYAQLAAEHPERIDQLREAVEFTASVMISNCPGVVTEFRKLSQEIDAFLQACKTGEVNPADLLERL